MENNNSCDILKIQNDISNEEKEEIIISNAKTPTNSSKKKKRIKVKAWCGECFQFFENGPFAKVCREHLTKGKCNLVECTKKLINEEGINCTRKFPNINSENRHTYCLTEDEVKEWDDKIKIQNCLGIKRNADRNYEKSKIYNFSGNKQNINSNSESPIRLSERVTNKNYFCIFKDRDKEKDEKSSDKNKQISQLEVDGRYEFDFNLENLFPQNNNQNYVYNLIDEINNLNFVEGEKLLIDDKLINEFNNFYFGSGEKIHKSENIEAVEKSLKVEKIEKVEKLEKVEIFKEKDLFSLDHNIYEIKQEIKESSKELEKSQDEKLNKIPNKIGLEEKSESKKEIDTKMLKLSHNNNKNIYQNHSNTSNSDIIQDEEKIDTIFEKIHSTSKIPKSALNKIKSALKKKGIFTAKILRLYKEKNKNWDFLIDNFKNVCSQIEGVALCIENILDGNQLKLDNKI